LPRAGDEWRVYRWRPRKSARSLYLLAAIIETNKIMTRPTSTQAANKLNGRDIALGLLRLAATALAERLLAKTIQPEQSPQPGLPQTEYDTAPLPLRTEDTLTSAISQGMASEVAEAEATYGEAYADQVAESNRRIAGQLLSQSQAGAQGLADIAGNFRG
jgi:hypothetical protein